MSADTEPKIASFSALFPNGRDASKRRREKRKASERRDQMTDAQRSRGTGPKKNVLFNFKMTEMRRASLKDLAQRMGVSQAAVLEMGMDMVLEAFEAGKIKKGRKASE